MDTSESAILILDNTQLYVPWWVQNGSFQRSNQIDPNSLEIVTEELLEVQFDLEKNVKEYYEKLGMRPMSVVTPEYTIGISLYELMKVAFEKSKSVSETTPHDLIALGDYRNTNILRSNHDDNTPPIYTASIDLLFVNKTS